MTQKILKKNRFYTCNGSWMLPFLKSSELCFLHVREKKHMRIFSKFVNNPGRSHPSHRSMVNIKAGTLTIPETNSSQLKSYRAPKGSRIVFQASFFRGELLNFGTVLLKLTAKAPENGWLEDHRFLLGLGPFSVFFYREGITGFSCP